MCKFVYVVFCDYMLTGDFQFVPSLPPPPEHNIPLRDRMLKRSDIGTDDGISPKRDNFVSNLHKVCSTHHVFVHA